MPASSIAKAIIEKLEGQALYLSSGFFHLLTGSFLCVVIVPDGKKNPKTSRTLRFRVGRPA